MALIIKKHVTERETASYKLDCATIELVKAYSDFIGSPQEHVVNEALLYIFRKDKDFAQWLKSKGLPNLIPAARSQQGSNMRTRRIVAAGLPVTPPAGAAKSVGASHAHPR
jgi:hypothetical protein